METKEQSTVTSQKPQVQSDLSFHQRAAAIEHERMTGADSVKPADPQTGEKPLTESQIAVVTSAHSGSPTSAATTGGSEDLAAESNAVMPVIGQMVRVHIIENGIAGGRLAYVTGVSGLDEQRLGENGEPYLTVVYMQDNPDRRLLGSPDWSKAFIRVGPVHHETSASAQAGRESVYWTDLLPDASEAISLSAMELDTAGADTARAALAQREAHGQAGRGPVQDASVPAQGATATDVVAQGRMPRPTPENPASVVAERITRPVPARNWVPPAGGPALAGAATPSQSELRQRAIAAGELPGANLPQNQQLDQQAESRAHEEPITGTSVGSTTTAAGDANETGLADTVPAAELAGAPLHESSGVSTAEKVNDGHDEGQSL